MDFSEDPLDNPIWNSLRTEHSRFAEGGDLARRFLPAIGPLAGLQEQSPAAYEELGSLLGPGGHGVLFLEAEPRLPADWRLLLHASGDQMIAREPVSEPTHSFAIEALGPRDVPEMVALAKLTDPGPFRERTIELGGFFGIREDGRLAAMAGQRLRMPGFVEVSGVCTHPEFRGRGYAQELVAHVTGALQRRGETPILHVYSGNEKAIRVYQRLGFMRRRSLHISVVMPPALDEASNPGDQ